jgi:hypothetical protein
MSIISPICGINSVKVISESEYKKLNAIEKAARKYAYNLSGSWFESRKLQQYNTKWTQYAEKLGIIENDENVYFKVKNGLDYSHGYGFWDYLA